MTTQLDIFGPQPGPPPGVNPRECWRTPPAIYRSARELAGISPDRLVCDVACTSHDCVGDWGYFHDQGLNGLSVEWPVQHVWCNPPYSDIAPWAERWHEHAHARGSQGMLLIPLIATTSGYWRRWIDTAPGLAVHVPDRRVDFIPPPGVEPSTPAGGVVLAISNAPVPGWHRWRIG